MNADELMHALRDRGLGVTVNAWTEEPEVAVIAWREGRPVNDAVGETLTGALTSLLEAEERAA